MTDATLSVRALVAWLGTYKGASEVVGRPATEDDCPIARFLTEALGYEQVFVDYRSFTYRRAGRSHRRRLPTAIARLVELFDGESVRGSTITAVQALCLIYRAPELLRQRRFAA